MMKVKRLFLSAILVLLPGLAWAQAVTSSPAPWVAQGDPVSLSASSSSSAVKLNWMLINPNSPPPIVSVCNTQTSAVDAYVKAGDSSVVATLPSSTSKAGMTYVAAGVCAPLALGGATYLAGITASSSTTLIISTGSGTPLAGGLGSGGGLGVFMTRAADNATSAAFGAIVGKTGLPTAQSQIGIADPIPFDSPIPSTQPSGLWSTLSGVAYWFDVTQGVYSDTGCTALQTTNGGTVSCLKDLTTNARNATGAANQPTLATNVINGTQSAISCNGTSSRLTTAYSGEPAAIYAVFEVNNVALPGGTFFDIIGADTSDAVTIGAYYLAAFGADPNTNSIRRLEYWERADSADTTAVAEVNVPSNATLGAWQSIGMTWDGTNAQLMKNGYAVGATASRGAHTVRPISSSNLPLICAGYFNHLAVDFANIKLAALVVWSTKPSAADYTAVSDYYNAKFGLNTWKGKYLFAGFQNGGKHGEDQGNEGLLMARTDDPINGPWYLQTSHLVPPTGHSFRDSSIIPYRNGYLMTSATMSNAASSGSSNNFDIYWSPGPISGLWNWTLAATVDCSDAVGSGTHAAVWGPNVFMDVDGTVHVIFSGSSDSTASPEGFLLYEKHPGGNNFADLTTWSTSVAMGGTDAGGYGIDPAIRKINGLYQVAYANDNTQLVEVQTATSLTGTYTGRLTGDWASWGSGYEGPIWLDAPQGNGECFALDKRGTGYFISCNLAAVPTTSASNPWPALSLTPMLLADSPGGSTYNSFMGGDIIRLYGDGAGPAQGAFH